MLRCILCFMPYVLYIQKITEKFFYRLETGFIWTRFPHIPYCLKSEIKKEHLFLEFEVSHSKLLLILLPFIVSIPHDTFFHALFYFAFIARSYSAIAFCSAHHSLHLQQRHRKFYHLSSGTDKTTICYAKYAHTHLKWKNGNLVAPENLWKYQKFLCILQCTLCPKSMRTRP